MPSLTSIFSQVNVSDSDGILILNDFMENNADRSPTLVQSLRDAIEKLAEGTAETSKTSKS